MLLPDASPAPPHLADSVQQGMQVVVYDDFVAAAIEKISATGTSIRLIDHNLNRYLLEQFINSHHQTRLFSRSKLSRAAILRRLCRLEYQRVVNKPSSVTPNANLKNMFASKDESLVIDLSTLLDSYHTWLREERLLNPALQVQQFNQDIIDNPGFRTYMQANYDLLWADNVEAFSKAAHDLFYWCLECLPTTLLTFDQDGDCRDVWGANPGNAILLRDVCQYKFTMQPSMNIERRITHLKVSFSPHPPVSTDTSQPRNDYDLFQLVETQSPAAMAQQCLPIIQGLPQSSTKRLQIAIITPTQSPIYLHDIKRMLDGAGRTYTGLEAFVSVPQDQFSAALVTILKLTIFLPKSLALQEITEAFQVLFTGIDPLRARLLALNLHSLTTVTQVDTRRIQARVSHSVIKSYINLIQTLLAPQKMPSLSHLLSALFETLAEQADFTLFGNSFLQWRAQTLLKYARFIESQESTLHAATKAFIAFLRHNSVFLPSTHQPLLRPSIVIGSVQRFLSLGYSVDYQIWLDVHHRAWTRQPEQVLFANLLMQDDSALQEHRTLDQFQDDLFYKRIDTLVRRCRNHIIAMTCNADHAGISEAHNLLQVINNMKTLDPYIT